ncbi:hypothetical protein JW935_02420 [candidate division KSB1 bacterium]|nr:hypothetical protein [candidate division KSB1 bacterium]
MIQKDNSKPVNKLQFCPVTEFGCGTVYSILRESYSGLLAYLPQHSGSLKRQWKELDDFAFFHPAQRMYRSAGFREIGRFKENFVGCIRYEMSLNS